MTTSTPNTTYRVRFCVIDHYTIDVKATGPEAAVEQARSLRDVHGEDPQLGFVFNITEGGDRCWQAEEVRS